MSDDTLPDGTKVYAGQAMFYCPYAMGRDPTIWKDPLVFDPSRWIDTDVGAETPHQVTGSKIGSLHKPTNISEYRYPVFNAGPRLCIGRPLALLEIQIGLGMVLTKFELEFARPHTDEYTQSLVCPMKHGLHVTAKPRA